MKPLSELEKLVLSEENRKQQARNLYVNISREDLRRMVRAYRRKEKA